MTTAPASAKRGRVRPAAGGAGREQRDVDARRVGGRDILDDDRLPGELDRGAGGARRREQRAARGSGRTRSARISRITAPTWPVAPTTATESPESEMRVMRDPRSRGGRRAEGAGTWGSPDSTGRGRAPGPCDRQARVERVPPAGLVERPVGEVDAVRPDRGEAHEQRQRRVAERAVVADDRVVVGRRESGGALEQGQPRGEPFERMPRHPSARPRSGSATARCAACHGHRRRRARSCGCRARARSSGTSAPSHVVTATRGPSTSTRLKPWVGGCVPGPRPATASSTTPPRERSSSSGERRHVLAVEEHGEAPRASGRPRATPRPRGRRGHRRRRGRHPATTSRADPTRAPGSSSRTARMRVGSSAVSGRGR